MLMKGPLMRVFVTSASGHLGSIVAPDLISAGHEVVGLARSNTSAAAMEKLSARTSQLRDADHAIRRHQQDRPFGKVVSVP